MEASYSGLYTMDPEKARGKSEKGKLPLFVPEILLGGFCFSGGWREIISPRCPGGG
jgi:hypothetical protein